MTRVALVTGGTGGIGAAVTRRLAREGCHVVVAGRVERDDIVAAAIAEGGTASSAILDVRDPEAAGRLVAETVRTQGSLDILVNSHGITGRLAPLIEHDDADWADVLAVNLTGAFNLCRAVVPQMLAQASGHIVNVSSIAGKEPNPNTAAYSTSKAGLIGLTKALAREVGERGVLVNCVTPGFIDTQMVADAPPPIREAIIGRTPLRRPGRPEEVAELIAWLCSPACSFTTGAVLDISGGRASY